MKFIIPQKDDLTLEVIKEEFLKKYYPEMTVRQGWWKIFGRYVMLQKNPFVCAAFYVKQKSKQQKTQIRIMKDSNIWANIIGAPVIQKFISGDFYVDIEYNFEKFLKKKYGLRDEEIVKEKWNRNFWMLAGVNLGVTLLIMAIVCGILSWKWANVWTYSATFDTEVDYAARDLGYDVVEANYEYKGRDLFGRRLIYGPEKKVLLEKDYISIERPIDDYVIVCTWSLETLGFSVITCINLTNLYLKISNSLISNSLITKSSDIKNLMAVLAIAIFKEKK